MTQKPLAPEGRGRRLSDALARMVGDLPLAALNAFARRRGYAIRSGVRYGDGPRQALDIYTPAGAGAETPIVVFFHGGSWDSGSKNAYLFVGQSLASGGVIAVLPDYRLHPEVVFPAFVEDAADAVAWVLDNVAKAGGRPRPLFVAGHSAGAHIAALSVIDKRYLGSRGVAQGAIAGLIGISGPYDFLPLTRARYTAIFPERLRAESQPIAFVDGSEPPTLLVTGDADRTVKPGNTARLAAAMRARGGQVSEIVYPGVGHLGTLAAMARILPIRKPPVRRDLLAFVRDVAAGVVR